MIVDCQKLAANNAYKLLTTLVTPRPIAWVATKSENGIDNLAPFSFFNVVSHDPPMLMFSCVNTKEGGNILKDTAQNILDTKEFVVNLVDPTQLEAMNATAASVPAEESEFDLAKLSPQKATMVKAPLLKESLVSFECILDHHYIKNGESATTTVFFGEIKVMHIADELIDDDLRINVELYQTVGKLERHFFTSNGEKVAIKRPK